MRLTYFREKKKRILMNLVAKLHHYGSDAIGVAKDGHIHLLFSFFLFPIILQREGET